MIFRPEKCPRLCKATHVVIKGCEKRRQLGHHEILVRPQGCQDLASKLIETQPFGECTVLEYGLASGRQELLLRATLGGCAMGTD